MDLRTIPPLIFAGELQDSLAIGDDGDPDPMHAATIPKKGAHEESCNTTEPPQGYYTRIESDFNW
jgi:hypothetical protein